MNRFHSPLTPHSSQLQPLALEPITAKSPVAKPLTAKSAHLLAIICAIAATSFFSPYSVRAAASEPASLIPKPVQVAWQAGAFTLNPQTRLLVAANGEVAREAQTLSAALKTATGFALPVQYLTTDSRNAIILTLDPSQTAKFGAEGYELDVTPLGAHITAASAAGLFYGGVTLRQLLPAQIFANHQVTGVAWNAPCCQIFDKPRFVWRAFLLDYARHFLDMAYTKHLLDVMAMHKMNVLQMHLTDDQGWRIEIEKYPKLTEIGAWRGTACKLPNIKGEHETRYGGFFTQNQIKEIVAYAAQRHINIVPEIDLPGHALASVSAYPEMAPSGVPAGQINDTISPAKEANYTMVNDIMTEVAALFPFDYIHVGGDEVNHGLWKNDPEIKALVQREKLGGIGGAQTYFTKRLETIIANHHKKMIGWNEILNNKLARTTVIMTWIGTGPGYHAAQMGFPVVMAAGPYTYFDMPYPHANDEPPSHWWAGPIDCAKAYSFDPLDNKKLKPEELARIMGVEGALWTEFVHPWKSSSGWANFKTIGEDADYKILPRLCALSEVAWTPQSERNYADFAQRLGNGDLSRLAAGGYNFRVAPPDAVIRDGKITIIPATPDVEIRYTTNGADPFKASNAQVWKGEPIPCSDPKQFRARAYFQGRPSPLHVGAHPEGAKK